MHIHVRDWSCTCTTMQSHVCVVWRYGWLKFYTAFSHCHTYMNMKECSYVHVWLYIVGWYTTSLSVLPVRLFILLISRTYVPLVHYQHVCQDLCTEIDICILHTCTLLHRRVRRWKGGRKVTWVQLHNKGPTWSDGKGYWHTQSWRNHTSLTPRLLSVHVYELCILIHKCICHPLAICICSSLRI